jgi:hypothetical protein
VLCMEVEIKEEDKAEIKECHQNLTIGLAGMEHNAKEEFIHSHAICLGLLHNLGKEDHNLPKWTKVSPILRTALQVVKGSRARLVSTSLLWKHRCLPVAPLPSQTPKSPLQTFPLPSRQLGRMIGPCRPHQPTWTGLR